MSYLICMANTPILQAQQPAFPGAEGAGMYTSGGRGTASTPTTVFEVTNLNDDNNPGSLRYALTAAASYRTVVFRVSGTIHLTSRLTIKANTTLAGQTAPGDGICVADYPVYIGGDNVIVRYMRFRLGDKNQKKTDALGNPVDGSGGDDAFGGAGYNNLIIDHVTASWSNDEVLSIYRGDNITIQWCFMTEPLNYSYHFEAGDTDYQQHGYGGIQGGKRASIHHNLYAHCRNRTPRFAGASSYSPAVQGAETVDFRNNVIYNWGINNVYGGEGGYYNMVNNYLKPGPSTTSRKTQIVAVDSSASFPHAKYYLTGNYITSSTTNTNNNWLGATFRSGKLSDTTKSKVDSPFNIGYTVTTQSALEAYEAVLKGSGCSLPYRDTLDQRIVNDVRNGTGRVIDVQGGYPHGTPYAQTTNAWPLLRSGVAPADADHDGMDDSWESSQGLNPNDGNDRNVVASNGYTNLENYLNSLTDASPNTNPVIYANASLKQFNQTSGLPSTPQNFTAGGGYLTDNITITPPQNYELSLDSLTWTGTVVLNQVDGLVASKKIYVRLNAPANGTYTGNITATSPGADTVNIAVSGTTSLPAVPTFQERLLYSTNFQEWSPFTSATETTVMKKTDSSNEDLIFKFYQVTVDPAGENTSRFNYSVVSKGWAQAQKMPGSYIETSPLKSITKVQFIQGATGSNRGFIVSKKGLLDPIWVPIYTTPCTVLSGEVVTVLINEPDVAIKFTNIDNAQNAYMFDLKIFGNYLSTKQQYKLEVAPNIAEAGTITQTPKSDTYDQGTTVKLQATRNFGYKFLQWVDTLGTVLSTANPYTVTVNADQKIIAVFDSVATYALNVNIEGSKWGEVQTTPVPVNGKFETGTAVTVKVIPNAATKFTHWEDNSTNPQRVVTIDGNKSLTATFADVPFISGWDFKASSPSLYRTGDLYAETDNTGMISAYEPDGRPVSWAPSAGAFSPTYPNIRLNTPAADFIAKRRYLQAEFSTLNHRNIQVTSLVGAASQAYAVQTLQYSLDKVNYTELARVDIASVFNTGWRSLNATLPADAEGKERIYIRWIADTASPILGTSTSTDGTSYTNVFVFADQYIPVDTTAPVFLASDPATDSKVAPINGTITLNFNEPMKAGSGNSTLGSTVLPATFGFKTVSFNYQKLAPNTPYTFTVPAGALTDLAGNAYPGITLTFTTSARPQTTKKLFDAVVAQDGTGDYLSIPLAIAAAPNNRTSPWLIYIKNGKYVGHIDILSVKPFIHLIGQSRDSVIISDNRLAGEDGDQTTPTIPVQQAATIYVNAPDCYFENLTIENSHGYERQAGPQALALFTDCDRFTSNNIWLRSYQDTWLTTYGRVNNRHYVKKSKIEGAVDFIYGGGDVFFDECTITCVRKDGGYIVAPSHQTGTLWGYVFSHCTIDESHASGVTTYLGRPWTNSPKTSFLYTTFKAKVYPKGWYYKMNAIPSIFADYGSMDASGNMIDTAYRIKDYEYDVKDGNGVVTSTVYGKAKSGFTDAEAATYTYNNVLMRSNSSWDPRMQTEAPEKPGKVLLTGSTLSWKDIPYSRLYIVFRNNKVVGFTTNNAYSDTTSTNGQTYSYAIQAVSDYGALSEPTIASTDTLPPTVRVKNITVPLNSSGKATITPAMVDNGSFDESGIDTLTLDKTDFDCSVIGGNEVTLTVKDKKGNVASAIAIVSVKDTIAPVAIAQNITIQLNDSGAASVSAASVNNGSNDVCGVKSITLSKTDFDCSTVGANNVSLIVTDNNGNVSTAPATVTVTDKTPPVIRVENALVNLVNGSATLKPSDIDNGSYDACGISTMAVSPTSFDCSNIGDHTVTLTITDQSGNTSSASAIVTIKGEVPKPTISVSRKDTTYTGASSNTILIGYGAQSLTLTAVDNSSATSTNCLWSPSAGLSSATVAAPVFTPTQAGSYTFSVTVTNGNGCSASASVTINVIDVRCGDKVLVCHNGGVICVKPNVVQSHLSHGDKLGNCNSVIATTAGNINGADIELEPTNGLEYKSIKVFPIPASDFLTVQFPVKEKANYVVELYDLKGALVKTFDKGYVNKNADYSSSYNVSGIPAGLYILRLKTGEEISTARIIIE